MKKLSLLIGFAFVALIPVVELQCFYIDSREDGTSTGPSHASNSVTRQHTSQKRLETEANSPRVMRPRAAATGDATDPREDDIERLRRELKTAKAELENAEDLHTEEHEHVEVGAVETLNARKHEAKEQQDDEHGDEEVLEEVREETERDEGAATKT